MKKRNILMIVEELYDLDELNAQLTSNIRELSASEEVLEQFDAVVLHLYCKKENEPMLFELLSQTCSELTPSNNLESTKFRYSANSPYSKYIATKHKDFVEINFEEDKIFLGGKGNDFLKSDANAQIAITNHTEDIVFLSEYNYVDLDPSFADANIKVLESKMINV